MTPDREVILLALYAGGCIGFIAGVITAGAIFSIALWSRAKWRRRNEYTVMYRGAPLPGQSFAAAMMERDAYRAEAELMMREDAGKTANKFGSMLIARVQMRMASEGRRCRHG